MANDIKAQVNQLVESIKKDPKLQEDFKKNPIKTVESVLGVDLPDDLVQKVVTAVKSQMTMGDVKDVMNLLKKFG